MNFGVSLSVKLHRLRSYTPHPEAVSLVQGLCASVAFSHGEFDLLELGQRTGPGKQGLEQRLPHATARRLRCDIHAKQGGVVALFGSVAPLQAKLPNQFSAAAGSQKEIVRALRIGAESLHCPGQRAGSLFVHAGGKSQGVLCQATHTQALVGHSVGAEQQPDGGRFKRLHKDTAKTRHTGALGAGLVVVAGQSGGQLTTIAGIMFSPSQADVRRFFCSVHAKTMASAPLEPLETIASLWISEHPEYHGALADVDAALSSMAEVLEERENPFLHLSMHLSISEQCSIDQPRGVRQALELLTHRRNALHQAHHEAMDCLGHMLWESQRAGRPPDGQAYLACIEHQATRD